MKFTVYVDDGDGCHVYEEYGGGSVYAIVASGALVVRPEEGGRVTFGPTGWSRVEEEASNGHDLPEIIH